MAATHPPRCARSSRPAHPHEPPPPAPSVARTPRALSCSPPPSLTLGHRPPRAVEAASGPPRAGAGPRRGRRGRQIDASPASKPDGARRGQACWRVHLQCGAREPLFIVVLDSVETPNPRTPVHRRPRRRRDALRRWRSTGAARASDREVSAAWCRSVWSRWAGGAGPECRVPPTVEGRAPPRAQGDGVNEMEGDGEEIGRAKWSIY